MIEKDPLTSIEARLSSLKPRDPRLDRDRLMFLAGRASVVYWSRYSRSSFRPVVLSALAAAAVTLFVVTATESGSRIVDRVASAVVPGATSADTAGSQPPAPAQNAAGCRLEIGNSLGWIVPLLVGQKPVEKDSTKSGQNLIQLREALLSEDARPLPSGPTEELGGDSVATDVPVAGRQPPKRTAHSK